MGLDMSGDLKELVRDRALIEMNVAVLSSFDKERITIIDHFTASESFIRHYNKEMETRGFIAGDWVWVTPPIGGSVNQVFHQEMVSFFIKPNLLPSSHTAKELLEYTVQRGLVLLSSDDKEGCDPTDAVGVEGGENALSPVEAEKRQAVYIYYGSETGVSESNAKMVKKFIDSAGGERCQVKQFASLNECDLVRFSTKSEQGNDDSSPEDTTESKLIVIVTSTFGSGGPPGNAAVLFSKLQDGTYDEANTDLTGINVAIFGNGDSSYTAYNNCAKTLESKFEALRATIVISGYADKVSDHEKSFQDWFAKLLTHTLCDAEKLAVSGGNKMFKFKERAYTVKWHYDNTKFLSTAVAVPQHSLKGRTEVVTELNREVCRFDFDMGKDLQIEDGDHIAVLPRNNPQTVVDILSILKLEADVNKYVEVALIDAGQFDSTIPSFLQGMYTLGEVLTDFIDLSAPPTYSFIQKVSTIALLDTHDRITLKYLALSVENFTKWVSERSPSLVDFFREFPSVSHRLQLSMFLMTAPRIDPRLYSLSSSSAKDENVSLTVRIEHVQNQKDGNAAGRRGLCSDYLWNLKVGDGGVRLYVSPSHEFHLIKDVPAVMISNGTGIAPFRSFWRTLADENGRVGADAALFYFGCRSKEDCIYADELKTTFADGNLAIAYSRENSSSAKYVTDLVSRDASRLAEYIDVKQAKIFVCGTNSMANDVREKITAIVGATKFKHLLGTQRYVEEFF